MSTAPSMGSSKEPVSTARACEMDCLLYRAVGFFSDDVREAVGPHLEQGTSKIRRSFCVHGVECVPKSRNPVEDVQRHHSRDPRGGIRQLGEPEGPGATARACKTDSLLEAAGGLSKRLEGIH